MLILLWNDVFACTKAFSEVIVFVIDRENKLDFLFLGKNYLMYCEMTNYAGVQKYN